MRQSRWRLTRFRWAAIALGVFVLCLVTAVVATSMVSMQAQIEALQHEPMKPLTSPSTQPPQSQADLSTVPGLAQEEPEDLALVPVTEQQPDLPVGPAPRNPAPEPPPVCPVGQMTVMLEGVVVLDTMTVLSGEPQSDILTLGATVRVTNDTNFPVSGSAHTRVTSRPLTLRDRLIVYSPDGNGIIAPGQTGVGTGHVTALRSEMEQISSWYLAEATGTFWYQDVDLRCPGPTTALVVIR